jgi:hypothetical protein
VLLLAGVLLSTFLPGRWRALRLLWIALLYLLLEAGAVIVLGSLWLAQRCE